MEKVKDREKWRLMVQDCSADRKKGRVADTRMYLVTSLKNCWHAVSMLHSFQLSVPLKLYYNFKNRFLFLTYNLICHTLKI